MCAAKSRSSRIVCSQYRRRQIPRSPRRVMTGDPGSPFGKDFAKAILMARQRPGKSASPGARSLPRRGLSPQAMHVVGQNDLGIDTKGRSEARLADRLAQHIDMRHQQIGAPIEQVQSKKESPAWNSIASGMNCVGYEVSTPCI